MRGLIIKWRREGAMIFIFLHLLEMVNALVLLLELSIFYKKKRSKVNRIPNGRFRLNVLF